MSVCRTVGRLACRSVDPVGYSVWLSVGMVGQSVGLSVNRYWSARQSVCRCQSGSRACFFEFGSSQAPLCCSGGAFGFICKDLGSNLGCLGLVLGSSGAPFWCSGGAFGVIFRVLGLTLGCLGVHVGRSGGILGAVGGFFGVRGGSVGRQWVP